MSFSGEQALEVISRCNPGKGTTRGQVFERLTGVAAAEPGVALLVQSVLQVHDLTDTEQETRDILHDVIMDALLLGAALAKKV